MEYRVNGGWRFTADVNLDSSALKNAVVEGTLKMQDWKKQDWN